MFGDRTGIPRDSVTLVLNDPPYGEPYNYFTFVHVIYGPFGYCFWVCSGVLPEERNVICKQDLSQRVTPFVFINYGEKYYSCDGTRGEVPGSRFKQFAPGIVQAWGELRRALQ